MQTLIMVGQLLLGLSILVFVHELGHFLAARLFKMRVDKFYVFFDFGKKKLYSFKKGDTEYGIGWFPLGGYVKIAGMIDESMDKEQMKQPPQPWEFRSKKTWQRLIVMVAGVFLNLIFGILIFSYLTFHFGEQYYPVTKNDPAIVAMDYGESIGFKTGDTLLEINGVKYTDLKKFTDILSFEKLLANNVPVKVLRNGEVVTIKTPSDFVNTVSDLGVGSLIQPAFGFSVRKVPVNSTIYKAGLRNGDRIIALNDTAIRYYYDYTKMISNYSSNFVKITIKRNNDTIVIEKAPVSADATLGFYADDNRYVETINYGLFESLVVGNNHAWHLLKENTLGFSRLFQGEVDPRKALKGPIGIASIYGGSWDWINFWTITGLISLILAFMNLLPIPALDGGHVITILIEMITGRPLSQKVLEILQTIGLIIVFAIIIFSVFNDIFQAWIR